MTNEAKSLDFSNILASSVHDMKNSISMLINTLDEVTDALQPSDENSATKLTKLKYESKRLNNHLVQMLALYKINHSQYFVNIEEHNLDDFIRETTLNHKELLLQNNISLECIVPDNLNWFFDQSLVIGTINNVVNNAYKYARSKVRISVSQENNWLLIVIADDGPGYPQEMLTNYDQQQTGISFETGSTGLGLYFSHQVATLHTHRHKNGHIQLDNNGIENGGRFSLYLP